MSQPIWDDPSFKAGTMVRGALWLLQVVGEGNTFTKEQLRLAFPGVSQADRRLRGLRSYGWIILTNTEDATLMAEDQRFVEAGTPVWEQAARRAAAPQAALTAKERKAVLARDDYMCTCCGISGGETYIDNPSQTAVLFVSRRATVLPDGQEVVQLVTECKVCRSGSPATGPARADEVLSEIKALEPVERRRLARWAELGRRSSTPLERAWSSYRRLPLDAQHAVRDALRD